MRRKNERAGSLWIPGSFDLRQRAARALVFGYPPSGGLAAVAATVPGFFVSPLGLSTNDGSFGSPWSLAFALSGAGGAIHPGDTVWLRGGVYAGIFNSTLAGTPNAPIIVRQYPGERAIISRSGAVNINTFSIGGQYTWYWGFEVANTTTNAPFDRMGIDLNGPGVKLINLVVYDHSGNGIGAWIPAPDAEVYGCIIYNNGWHGSTDSPPSHGHGLYTQNQTGAKLLQDNILFNQFGKGFQVYGSDTAFLNNYTLDGNVSFGSGSPIGVGNPDFLVGGFVGMTNLRMTQNMSYQQDGSTSVWIGWTSAQNADMVTQNNYFAGAIQVRNWTTAVFTNNRMQHSGKFDLLVPGAAVPSYTWDGNDYVMTHANDGFGGPFGVTKGSTAQNYATLAAWQAATGLDATSTFSQPANGKPTGSVIFVRPNRYEPGRANIIIYNWDQLAAITVPPSQLTMLTVGDSYRVFNVQSDPAMQGAGVASGTFTGAGITLPMAGVTPVPSVGTPLEGLVPSPITGPEFNVFVLRKV